MAPYPTNIDASRSPIATPFAILGAMSALALAAAVLAVAGS
jgi:hypothetical protein